MRRILPLFILALLTSGVRAEITAVVWSREMRPTASQWQTEVARKYTDAVIVFCHGDDRGGKWVFVPDAPWAVEPVAAGIKRLRQSPVVGNRRIVLVTCNPGSYALPRDCGPVTFAPDGMVRISPDKAFIAAFSRAYYGNVFELTEQ
jgi:hypothetical protein